VNLTKKIQESTPSYQILVLPPYQGEGHGLRLLEAINYIAQSENIYDVTIEDPSDYLQYVRSSIDASVYSRLIR
jgi:GNAT superfamily N-acetyltransferase